VSERDKQIERERERERERKRERDEISKKFTDQHNVLY
jgi:hypothetical protein